MLLPSVAEPCYQLLGIFLVAIIIYVYGMYLRLRGSTGMCLCEYMHVKARGRHLNYFPPYFLILSLSEPEAHPFV